MCQDSTVEACHKRVAAMCCLEQCHTVQHTHIRAEEVTSRLLAVACALMRIASASPAAVVLTNDQLVRDCSKTEQSCLHHSH